MYKTKSLENGGLGLSMKETLNDIYGKPTKKYIGTGKLPDTIEMRLDPNIKPKENISIALVDKLENRMITPYTFTMINNKTGEKTAQWIEYRDEDGNVVKSYIIKKYKKVK